MTIKLYKKCILNKNYTEVFYKNSIVDEYLNTLESKTINCNYVYQKLTGTINLRTDSSIDIFNYNYLTLDDNARIYCFIDDVELVSGGAIIYYSTDVWHTNIVNFSLRESLLNRTKFPSNYDCEYAQLPVKYMVNGNLGYNALTNINRLQVVLDIQIFNLAAGGENTERIPLKLVAKPFMLNGSPEYYTIDNVVDFLLNMYGWTNSVEVRNASTERFNGYHVEIVNSYIVPHDFNIANNLTKFCELWYKNSDYEVEFGELYSTGEKLGQPISSEFTIPEVERLIGCGTRLNITEIPVLKKQQNIVVQIYMNNIAFKILLNINGKIIDATDLYCFDSPVNSISTTEQQLRQLNRMMRNVKGATDIISGVTDMAQSLTKLGGNIIGNVMGLGMPSKSIGLQALDSSGGIVGGGLKIANGIAGLLANNAEIYTSNYKNDSLPDGVINAFYGLGYFVAGDVYNSKCVSDSINETGYIVKKFINEIKDLTQENIDYDIIKFDFIRINGCTSYVNDIIETILLNGTKIWYKSTVS